MSPLSEQSQDGGIGSKLAQHVAKSTNNTLYMGGKEKRRFLNIVTNQKHTSPRLASYMNYKDEGNGPY